MPEAQPVPFEEVVSREYEILRPDLKFPSADRAELFQQAHGLERPLSALCISGGGIRSATFALGALQGLAEQGVLEQFDYLSTVSGGGYIGGWLTAWINRAKGIGGVVPHLRRNAPPPAPNEADPIQHLREYNNYLSPKLGAFSGDTWTLASTITRNIFLNWLVLIPLLMLALMAPRLLLSTARYAEFYEEVTGSADPVSNSPIVDFLLPVVSGLLFALSLYNILRYLPGVGKRNHTAGQFMTNVFAPLIGATMLFFAHDSLFFYGSNSDHQETLMGICLWMLTPCLGAWLAYLLFCGKPITERLRLAAGPMTLAIVLMGLGTGVSAWLLSHELEPVDWSLYVTFGPPLLLSGFGIAGALFIGLSSTLLKDDDREWLARAAGRMALFCLIWIVACAMVLILPGVAFGWNIWGKSVLAGAGAIAAWSSSWAGFRSKSKRRDEVAAPPSSVSGIILKIAPPVFIALLALGLAILTNWLMYATGSVSTIWWRHEDFLIHTPWQADLVWIAIFGFMTFFMARFININKFSLQAMYRDRLIRAYLGASNPKREANKFTGFSDTDNFEMRTLDPTLRPFHVVNMTLNVVAGDRLALQQRKAETFTATAFHCGNFQLGYRDSEQYGGAISLGTAITISGAAASPNMGYHSSPVVGFIMTLFNARLGAWMGNPGAAGGKTWKMKGPESAIGSLVKEAFGLTTDTSEYVYLSDGGHFENLGLYEMVLRRCHSIVVLDGGCDDTFTYEDLGNALRKIRIDLRIPIVFTDASSGPLRARKKRCSIATIQYSAVDGEDAPNGELIYIKPMCMGNEPPDVASYASANPTFPHQSTADQWFDESQTESYRMLGMHTIDEMCDGWKKGALGTLREHVQNKYLDGTPLAAVRTMTVGGP